MSLHLCHSGKKAQCDSMCCHKYNLDASEKSEPAPTPSAVMDDARCTGHFCGTAVGQ